MATETIERSFQTSQPARLKVSNIRGSISIQPGADGEIKVLAVKHLDTGNAERSRIEISQETDGRVTVKTHYDHDFGLEWLAGSRPCKVDYTIQVPPACAIQAHTVSGSTSVKEVQGEVGIKSVSGNVHLAGLTGKTEMDIVSGDVDAERLSGSLKAEAVSGNVVVRQSNCPTIKASTVSGKLEMETPLGEGPYDFRSVSGAIQLIVPGETGCRVRMTSISGRIHTTMPVTTLSSDHGHQSAEVQGGGVGINVNTVSGRFSLEHTGEVRPVKQQKNSEERKAILERVASGEITVQEALKELNN